uniref:Membrane protein n=1 Tax=Stigmatella aurantiaca TaxID=41 RepID=A0A1P8VQE3_STIAU|nr:membrane protein [Stigmatella aurantiaca]
MSILVLLRLVHLVAVVVFLGDIAVTAVWRLLADRTREPRVIVYALRLVLFTDKYLLTPSVLVLVITGFLSAYLRDIPLWSNPFYAVAQILFMASGVLWNLVLRPVQSRQLAIAETLGASEEHFADYLLLTKKWLRWGVLTMVCAFGSMVLMVLGSERGRGLVQPRDAQALIAPSQGIQERAYLQGQPRSSPVPGDDVVALLE